MHPIAGHLAVKAVRAQANSALPDAPVRPDPPPHEARLRKHIAAFLRASAQRRSRLADRLDPCLAKPLPC
ncbi:hypothetical protein [Nocardia seriolae]|uniref:Uncharacterized protein n=1 Tax=Nocardia seriolae TaxID=37332 RepID=A0A0B8N717_9NOCA|nr:hypothetical protein [Nocardia seriolae]APA99387.1 hypothetical protein NS506_05341 [Nocardia seriolae]MTJ63225.1 hypothetical protein [Nocardia seriolae]MTJ72163.1 hypothetical protein [Nocardia seriolae]MTJ88972.1 hypothetical protein [Nocardia seriolae]MTK32952.1 hypothetical protein [Nocardia seriolae]